MKHILEFTLPEESELFEDHLQGLKYKWFLDAWLQSIKYEIESGKIKTAGKLLERLKQDLAEYPT